jgi:hypothetical protein
MGTTTTMFGEHHLLERADQLVATLCERIDRVYEDAH